jgi:hypothetical protein
MARFLIIVSPREPRLHAHLRQVFGDNTRVEIVYDRRTGQQPPPEIANRRQHDVSASLDGLGWAIVVKPDSPPREPPPPAGGDDAPVSPEQFRQRRTVTPTLLA